MFFESIGSSPWLQLLQLDGFDVLDSRVIFFRIDDVGTCLDRSLLATADRFEVASPWGFEGKQGMELEPP